jgi:hypothetical protein
MNVFRSLKLGQRPAAAERGLPREMLPVVDSFVDVAVGDRSDRHSVPVDALDAQTFSTRLLPDLGVGEHADFLYTTSVGRFRFTTTCCRLDETHAHFKTPTNIKTIVAFGSKRRSLRVESTLAVQWRYAPSGVGNGDYLKGALSDVSRGGASLVVGREIKCGTQVELRLTLAALATPVIMIAQVLRSAKIASSGKYSAAVCFDSVDEAAVKAIEQFVHERQQVRRDRGVI